MARCPTIVNCPACGKRAKVNGVSHRNPALVVRYCACPACGSFVDRQPAEAAGPGPDRQVGAALARWALAEWQRGGTVMLVIPREKQAGVLAGLRELRKRFAGD